jgi:hypothetical protein
MGIPSLGKYQIEMPTEMGQRSTIRHTTLPKLTPTPEATALIALCTCDIVRRPARRVVRSVCGKLHRA